MRLHPVPGQVPQPFRLVDTAVVPPAVPDDLHGCLWLGGADLVDGGGCLGEGEQGVGLARADERRRGDSTRHRTGAGARHERGGTRGHRAPFRGDLEGLAPVGGEPAARSGRGPGLQQPHAEEAACPPLLEDPEAGACDALSEQRRAQVVPGDVGCDRVHALVVARRHERERAAIGPAREAHPWICVTVLDDDVRPIAQRIDHGPGIGDLVVRGVHRDRPGRRPEPARRVREDDEPALDELLRLLRHGLLAPPESVGQHHRGRRSDCGPVEIDSEIHRCPIGGGGRPSRQSQ